MNTTVLQSAALGTHRTQEKMAATCDLIWKDQRHITETPLGQGGH